MDGQRERAGRTQRRGRPADICVRRHRRDARHGVSRRFRRKPRADDHGDGDDGCPRSARRAIRRARVPRSATAPRPTRTCPWPMKGTSAGDGAFGVSCDGGDCTFQIDALSTNFSGIGCQYVLRNVLAQSIHARSRRLSDHDHLDLDDLRQRQWAGMPRAITSTSTCIRTTTTIRQRRDARRLVPGLHDAGARPTCFTTITLPMPIVVNGPGDVLIALTNPAPNVGSRPASADTGHSPGAPGSRDFETWVSRRIWRGRAPAESRCDWRVRRELADPRDGTNAAGQPIVLQPSRKILNLSRHVRM